MSLKVGSLVSCHNRGSVIYKITAISGDEAKIQTWNGTEEIIPMQLLRPAASYAVKQRKEAISKEFEFLET